MLGRSFRVAKLVVLSLLLLSSTALPGATGQSGCTLALGDVTVSDFRSSSAGMVGGGTAYLFPYTAPASLPNGGSINSLSILVGVMTTNTQPATSLVLGLYDANRKLLATSRTQSIPLGASGLFTAQLGSPPTVTLTAGSQYYLASLSSSGITLYFKSSTAGGLGFKLPGYAAGLQPSYPATPTYTQYSLTSSQAAQSCLYSASGNGDPLFTGFLGQQFYISGVDSQVMTVLSSHNLQVNARLLQLEDGQSMLPYEQDKLRQASELRLADDPTAPAALPVTTAWTHPGTYFGECGVVLFDHNRLHAKAGAYEHGWAALTLNRRPLPVSDVPVVIGHGANTTYIHRTDSHTITIRTATVQVTLVNSDRFLDIERVSLESGYDIKTTRLGGILGGTADASWTWQPAVELDNTVQSGDLFDRQQMVM